MVIVGLEPEWADYINKIENTRMKSFRSPESVKHSANTVDPSTIQNMFELDYQYQIFLSRCQDTGEKPDVEKAKMFKQGFNKINSKKYPQVLNLYSMRLGVNTIMKLISIFETTKFKAINVADNSISEYGMHAIKNLLNSTQIESLNVASNMISEVGLSLVLDELIRNAHLKCLDLGILEGSIRKNSFGIDGARCLAAVLLQNKTLEVLRLEDNDIGINGAEIISIPLKRNKTLKELKIAENLIKTQGAEYILHNAIFVESLDLSKNFIKSSIGPAIEKYLQTNKNLRKINLQFNELLGEGVKILFEGIMSSGLIQVNIKGNGIGNRGLALIASTISSYGQINNRLKHLDLSSNDITDEGVESLIAILGQFQLKSLNLSKNNFGDTGVTQLLTHLKGENIGNTLEKLDLSATKMSDKSFLFLLQVLNDYNELQSLRCNDNFISEKYEKLYIDLLNQNKTLISLSLNGNRISLSCVKSIKKVIDRNLKEFQQKEPNKMKSQIYNMKQKQKKIKQAQERLQKQKNQIIKLQQSKNRLSDNLVRLEREEKEKRAQYQDLVRTKLQQIDILASQNTEKIENLQKLKLEKQRNLQELDQSLAKLRQRRKQLQYQLSVIKNQGELIEDQFQRRNSLL